jgi:hypothetical protein
MLRLRGGVKYLFNEGALMPDEQGSIPEQSGLSRRETLKLVAAVAAFGAALGVRPADSLAQAKGEGKEEGKGETKAEGKGATKGEGKGAVKGEGKGAAKGEGKGAAKGEGKGETKGEGKGETKGEGKATGK